ncbi:MAG TPA: hypothetical protein VIW29_15550 [Polyangiaceae bacterium]
MSRIVAQCNGTEIIDRGDEAWIVMKELPSPVWTIVAALLACVTFVNGTLQGIYAAVRGGNQHVIAAVVLLGLGFAFMKAGIGLRRAATKAAEAPGKPSLIFADGLLLDGERRELAPIESVRLSRSFQVTSSSRALTLKWPSGSLVVARGNPFGDSIDDCVSALELLGLRPS